MVMAMTAMMTMVNVGGGGDCHGEGDGDDYYDNNYYKDDCDKDADEADEAAD